MKNYIMTSIFGIFIFLSCDSDNVTGDDSNLDCAGVTNGNSVEDNCGICDEDPTNDCVQDCSGAWGGNAAEDCADVVEERRGGRPGDRLHEGGLDAKDRGVPQLAHGRVPALPAQVRRQPPSRPRHPPASSRAHIRTCACICAHATLATGTGTASYICTSTSI